MNERREHTLVMAAVLIFLGVRFRQLQARVEGIPPTGPAS